MYIYALFFSFDARSLVKPMGEMATPYHILLALLLAFPLVAHGQSGFISIDCGKAEGYSFEDAKGINYTSDAAYINTGKNHQISRYIDIPSLDRKLKDLRSFPNGKRNCYALPVTNGRNYLVRGYFLYGNYDGLGAPPEFDLYMGTNLWTKVSFLNASSSRVHEIIAFAESKRMSICLVEIGLGKPFISALELRPFSNYRRYCVNSTQSLLTVGAINFGAQSEVRYPEDEYDRIWTPFLPAGAEILSTSSAIVRTDAYDVPTEVMQTAATPATTTGAIMNFAWPVVDDSGRRLPYLLYKHFAELKSLASDESRIFNFSENGLQRIGSCSPEYLDVGSWRTGGNPRYYRKLEFSLYADEGSTLPPIINAMQIYQVEYLKEGATDTTEVEAMLLIKASYHIQKNWMGDPCAPKDLVWDGLGCIYSVPPYRVISMNLSGSGLVGTICSSLANLTQLQSLDLSSNNLTGFIPDLASISNLEFLDLSTNNLTGDIPSSLASLRNLKLLNLTCNRLKKPIPEALQERVDAKLLTLVTGPCFPEGSEPDPGKDIPDDERRNKTIILVVSLVGSILFSILLVPGLILLWKRRQNQTVEIPVPPPAPAQSNCRQFTYDELAEMTNGFRKLLGKGGTSSVYLGHLKDKTAVAVKKLSEHSVKQFADEVEVLKTIHHRYVITLIGYCHEKNNLALVYEYMPRGSLADQLSDQNDERQTLSWCTRLQVAYEAAQGLVYLHYDCRDTIVHRDIKTTNILLTNDYSARIADFGISKFLPGPGQGQPSTRILGTPGYVDPEYVNTAEPTTKSDVYSFGVILLEIITGQPAIPRATESNPGLTQWVKGNLKTGDLNRIVDRRLKGYNAESIWAVIELAMECIEPASQKRPDMRGVVTRLGNCMRLEDIPQRSSHWDRNRKSIGGNTTDVNQDSSGGFSVGTISGVPYRPSPR